MNLVYYWREWTALSKNGKTATQNSFVDFENVKHPAKIFYKSFNQNVWFFYVSKLFFSNSKVFRNVERDLLYKTDDKKTEICFTAIFRRTLSLYFEMNYVIFFTLYATFVSKISAWSDSFKTVKIDLSCAELIALQNSVEKSLDSFKAAEIFLFYSKICRL